ncbi:hypothetical protein SARC_10915 [Sphaeroforma arctica JP610]|uniref:Uncharacterized protein n=1 Tax=Sphaeroforma arctica JP610 TaxID=667725 RepID=A0A0L0FIJ8_9EUKA|nr:hypothetical protein SARC_10915 [Sphaeroforma arctica JP610]KNC76594.1 hypothetical protein SARC_10915 [Sphaeroforma arctica JP610]|eukprot:XP_014150496.1 hypothetical protein SARC_10915 [Sphaeroforma arctica JP610]
MAVTNSNPALSVLAHQRFDVDGEIAHAVNNALNGVIVEAIPQINAMLKLMPF